MQDVGGRSQVTKNGEMDGFTIEKARNLNKFTDRFMCKISDNIYKIKFLLFRVRDLDSNEVLFEVESEEGDEPETDETVLDSDGVDKRVIKYVLGSDFLNLSSLGSTLRFSVGEKEVKNFLMIEKHFFKDKLIKSYEFKFDYCIPGSVNEWESMYILPELSDEEKEELINNPWDTRSDSFYFVGDKLVMHHKALYNYSDQ